MRDCGRQSARCGWLPAAGSAQWPSRNWPGALDPWLVLARPRSSSLDLAGFCLDRPELQCTLAHGPCWWDVRPRPVHPSLAGQSTAACFSSLPRYAVRKPIGPRPHPRAAMPPRPPVCPIPDREITIACVRGSTETDSWPGASLILFVYYSVPINCLPCYVVRGAVGIKGMRMHWPRFFEPWKP